MTINRNIQTTSSKDTYILLMSQEERTKAKTEGLITDQDIHRVGPPLSAEEKDQFFNSISFARLLFIMAKSSMGKTEFEMDNITKQLEELKNEINTISQAIGAANELSAKKDPKDQKFKMWDKKRHTVTHPVNFYNFLDDLDKKYNTGKQKNVDVDIFFGKEPGQGQHADGIRPDVAIDSLRNISSFLDGRIKKLTPEIQKKNADINVFTELMSFVGKKVAGDLPAAILRNL